MKDDRLRVPIDEPYLRSIGLATICFARIEWDAVWCCERAEPGYIASVKTKTAGQIANDLVRIAEGHADPAIAKSLGQAARGFKALVIRRNDLVHANPGTSKTGEQRLFRHGAEWSIADIDHLADEFVAAAGPLNHHHHHIL